MDGIHRESAFRLNLVKFSLKILAQARLLTSCRMNERRLLFNIIACNFKRLLLLLQLTNRSKKTSPRHLKDFKSVYEVVFHRSSITLSLAFNLFSGSSKLSKFIFLKRAMGDAWRDKSLHHVFHEQRKAFTVNFGHDVILFIALLNNN